MEGRNFRTRHVSPGGTKSIYARPPDPHHLLAEKFAQFACLADFGLPTPSVADLLHSLRSPKSDIDSKGTKGEMPR